MEYIKDFIDDHEILYHYAYTKKTPIKFAVNGTINCPIKPRLVGHSIRSDIYPTKEEALKNFKEKAKKWYKDHKLNDHD